MKQTHNPLLNLPRIIYPMQGHTHVYLDVFYELPSALTTQIILQFRANHTKLTCQATLRK